MEQKTSILKQPPAFYLVYWVELWERFGTFAMLAISFEYLVFTQHWFTEAQYYGLKMGTGALGTSLMVVGGLLADHVLGTKRNIWLGASSMAIGHILYGLSNHGIEFLYLGMAFNALGGILFCGGPVTLLSYVYERKDPRRDSAYTMFYMAINLGSFVSTLITPIIANKYGHNYAFYITTIGLFIAIANSLYYRNKVKAYGSKPDMAPLPYKTRVLVTLGFSAFISGWYFLLQYQEIAKCLAYIVLLVAIALFAIKIYNLASFEKKRMALLGVLYIQMFVFLILYSIMETNFVFFARNNVHASLLGFEFDYKQWNALNPFFIMLFSPVLAMLYIKWGNKVMLPQKFAVGLWLCAAAFLVLPLGLYFAKDGVMDGGWFVANYLLQGLGELLVSGLSNALIARTVPQKMMGFVMSSSGIVTAQSGVVAAAISKHTVVKPGMSVVEAASQYSDVYLAVGLGIAVVALASALLAPYLSRKLREI